MSSKSEGVYILSYISIYIDKYITFYSHNKIHYEKLSKIAASGQPMTHKVPIIIKHKDRQVMNSVNKYRAEKRKTAKFQELEKNMAISHEN